MPCQGAQTLSKATARNPIDYPSFIERGQGSHVWDVDGHEYIDYMAALGPIVLGYNYPAVTEAVVEQARKGVLFSLEHPLVVEVAEMLTEILPGADAVRFVKTGSAATSAAVRAARTYTGRDVVLVASNSYHGQDDYFQVTQLGRGEYGVPKNLADNIDQFTYGDAISLQERLEWHAERGTQVAAVLIEPARTFMASFEFLRKVKKLCVRYGALYVADEVVTFGRFNGLTYSAWCGVTPDLICLGKAMGNGYATGAVAGRRDVMDAFEKCFISGTYNGELIGLAAAKATLNILRSEPVADHIYRAGSTLMAGFEGAMNRHDVPAYAEGIPVCWRQTFTGPRAQELKMRFMAECAARGVLPGLITYVGYSHSDEDIRRTAQVYYEVAEVLEKWLEEPREGAR